MKGNRSNKRKVHAAWGIDPVDRCNPPIAYREHSITLDCGHGRCGGGVAIFSAPLKTSDAVCYNALNLGHNRKEQDQ